MSERGFAKIDWQKSDFDLEFTCVCGEWSCAVEGQLGPIIQCPACDRVFQTESRIDFLPPGSDPWSQPAPTPGNCFQWKNVDARLECHCGCGHQFEAKGEMLYSVECPACHQVHVNPVRLEFKEIVASQATGPIYRMGDSET